MAKDRNIKYICEDVLRQGPALRTAKNILSSEVAEIDRFVGEELEVEGACVQPLEAPRCGFNVEYWRSRWDDVRVVGRQEGGAELKALDPLTQVATSSARSGLTGFVSPLRPRERERASACSRRRGGVGEDAS